MQCNSKIPPRLDFARESEILILPVAIAVCCNWQIYPRGPEGTQVVSPELEAAIPMSLRAEETAALPAEHSARLAAWVRSVSSLATSALARCTR